MTRGRSGPTRKSNIMNNLCKRAFSAALIFSVVAWGHAAIADDLTEATSLITLNTRTFDMRADITDLRRDDNFIPLLDVDWINQVLTADPYLNRIVVHIELWPDALRNSWPTLEPQHFYPVVDGIPEAFQVDGMLARAGQESFRSILLVPIEDPYDFQVRCSKKSVDVAIDTYVFGACFVRASYPPDPRIVLLARIYQPGVKPFHFREIAHRMREIALCLDVTDAVAAGSYEPAPYIQPGDILPDMTDCHRVTS